MCACRSFLYSYQLVHLYLLLMIKKTYFVFVILRNSLPGIGEYAIRVHALTVQLPVFLCILCLQF